MDKSTAGNFINSLIEVESATVIDKKIYSKYQSQIREKIEEIYNDEKKLEQLQNVLATLIKSLDDAQQRMSTQPTYFDVSVSDIVCLEYDLQSLMDKAKNNPKEFILECFVRSMIRICISAMAQKNINRMCVSVNVLKRRLKSSEEFQMGYLDCLSELAFDFNFLNVMGRQIAEEHRVSIKGLLIAYKRKNKIR